MSEGDLREQIRHECSRDVWYEAAALKEYAEQYLDDTGDWESIPEHLRGYFDTEAYARDMGYNGAYAFEFAGKWWVSE
jgi:antirestriction protein